MREYLRYLLPVALVAAWAVARGHTAEEATRARVEERMVEGMALVEAHRLSDAEKLFREVIAQAPDEPAAVYQLALTLDALGRPDEAQPYWAEVAEAAETVRDDARLRAARDRLKAQPLREAQALLRRGEEALYKENDPARAVKWLKMALERVPEDYATMLHLARALDAAGQRAEAEKTWRKLLPEAEARGDRNVMQAAQKRLDAPLSPLMSP